MANFHVARTSSFHDIFDVACFPFSPFNFFQFLFDSTFWFASYRPNCMADMFLLVHTPT